MAEVASFFSSASQVVSTAIHAGHELRPSLERRAALADATRRREEDPFTDRLVIPGGGAVVVHRSRFEFDLNRPRDGAVYLTPEDAWGLEVWDGALPPGEREESLRLYDEFYAELGRHLDDVASRGPFVVLDLHSYNHRRSGPDDTPEPDIDNPEVNVGTRWVDDGRWGNVVSDFMGALRQRRVRGALLDVRENVRFKGGHLSRWVNERYHGAGFALAIEFKKVFMDEWTGVVDHEHLQQLQEALERVTPTLLRGPDVPAMR
jgi:N-formylglutamate deformylase